MRALQAAACVLALLAVAAPPAAAGRLGFDICEQFNKTSCLEHSDTCVVCRAWDKLDVCIELKIAERLPKKLFTCDFPPPPEPPTSPEPSESPEPDTNCGENRDEESCEGAHCVWCLSAAVPSACYTEAEAKRLPAAVFQCKFPALLSEQ